MNKRQCLARLAGMVAAGLGVWPVRAAGSYRELKWEDLVPKDWDPSKEMTAMRMASPRMALLGDDDPKVQALQKKMREIWDSAPTVPGLDGASVRLPGYVVPLEMARDELKEFLLVPYFGACIHSPPPPANQIVHVVVGKPVKGIRSMDTVWVSGVIKTGRQDSAMGMSGYRMSGASVAPYEGTAGR